MLSCNEKYRVLQYMMRVPLFFYYFHLLTYTTQNPCCSFLSISTAVGRPTTSRRNAGDCAAPGTSIFFSAGRAGNAAAIFLVERVPI